MKKLLYLFYILITANAFAQDTIHTQDMPAVGNMFTMSIGQQFAGMDVSITGANSNWDYSQLGRTSQRIDTMIDPTSTNPLLAFAFINSPLNINKSNLAMRGNNFTLGTTGLSDVFNFYYNSQSQLEQPGFGAVINGVPMPLIYTPHDVIYKFPLKFGDEDSVSYTYQLDLSQLVGIYYSVDRSRHNEVDGWGTLTTPFGTFSTIRVKSTIVEQDSFYVDTFGFGVKTPPITSFEYKWLAPGKGVPLLQINTTGNQVTQITYQDSTHTIGIDEIPASLTDVSVYPNPATTKIFIRYEMIKNGSVDISLYSIEGRQAFTLSEAASYGSNFRCIDLAPYKLAPGNYFIKLHNGSSDSIKAIQIN